METSIRSHLDDQQLDKVIRKYNGKPGELLGLLEEVQELNKYKYLPETTLNYISAKTKTPLSQIYSVVTFYSFFNLKPQGEHSIIVCRGTACHTKGSKAILDDLGLWLGGREAFSVGESSFTTPDNKFTIRTVACFGQCALSPVVSIDGEIHSNVTSDRVRKIIDKVKKGGNKNEIKQS